MSIRTKFTFVAYTTAASPTGRKWDTGQTELRTCASPFIVAGVASRYKYVGELRHRLGAGSVEGVQATVMPADIRCYTL